MTAMIAYATQRVSADEPVTERLFGTRNRDMICQLRDKVAQAIDDAPHLTRQHLRFETSEGRVILRGIVGSYFHKQMAQEAIRGVDGVHDITNELEVCWS